LAGLAAPALVTQSALAADKLSVVATTGMIADAVRRIGGAAVEVRGLMGPGVDPHGYRQTRTDIVAMTRADIVFWHGLYLEAQMEGFFHKLEKRGSVIAVTDQLPRDLLRGHDDYDDKFDPHVWMDPNLWVLVADRVRDALIEKRPGNREMFEANAAAFTEELRVLAGYADRTLATVNAESRVLLTAHDAFGYFGEAYDFEVLGIQGISTDSEAGLNRIGMLVDMLVRRKISAVFVESSVSDRSMRSVIEGAAAKGHEVKIGGELFSDAMGAEGTYEGTYVGMIDHNVTVIASALGGDAPARGLNGRLSAGS
jgi:manganese/zinc/iron transport system substrate-binding protein